MYTTLFTSTPIYGAPILLYSGKRGHYVDKAAGGRGAAHPFPTPAKVKMSGVIPPLHLYAFIAGTYALLPFNLTCWRNNQTSLWTL